ncbi:unnamed protein product [Brassica oleracea]
MEEVKEEKPIGNQQVQGENRHGDTACKIRSLPSRHRHSSVICYRGAQDEDKILGRKQVKELRRKLQGYVFRERATFVILACLQVPGDGDGD